MACLLANGLSRPDTYFLQQVENLFIQTSDKKYIKIDIVDNSSSFSQELCIKMVNGKKYKYVQSYVYFQSDIYSLIENKIYTVVAEGRNNKYFLLENLKCVHKEPEAEPLGENLLEGVSETYCYEMKKKLVNEFKSKIK